MTKPKGFLRPYMSHDIDAGAVIAIQGRNSDWRLGWTGTPCETTGKYVAKWKSSEQIKECRKDFLLTLKEDMNLEWLSKQKAEMIIEFLHCHGGYYVKNNTPHVLYWR